MEICLPLNLVGETHHLFLQVDLMSFIIYFQSEYTTKAYKLQ
jgi:hypothetical protein